MLKEALIVVLGIAFFSWLTLRSINICGVPSKWGRAYGETLAICCALEEYDSEYGRLPGNAQTMKALNGENPKKIVFLSFRNLHVNRLGECLDPWGTPYRIGSWEEHIPWVYSCGKNRKDEGGAWGTDDISSWQ